MSISLSTAAKIHKRVSLVRVIQSATVRWVVAFVPTFLAAAYFLAIAQDQFESQAAFVVRSAARPETSGGLAFLVQLGIAKSQDDSFIVQEFMRSRDAIHGLEQQLPLKEMFDPPGTDFVARYPSILYGAGEEEFYRYFQRMVSIVHSDKTGISTLKVRAFLARDAYEITQSLLRLGEDMVNRLNERLLTDAVGNSRKEVGMAQQRLIKAQTALTEFRNREMLLNPAQNAIALAELIARLSAELGATQAQIIEMKAGASGSPQLVGLQRKAQALQEQIGQERARIASSSDDLAGRIVAYERLSLEREFSNRMLGTAEAELLRSRNEANRQLLYLERVVNPNQPDYRAYPQRLRSLLTIFAANCLALAVGWLIWSGVREHAQ